MAKRKKGIQDLLPSEEGFKTYAQHKAGVAGLVPVQCADCLKYVRPKNLEKIKNKHPESFLKQAPDELAAWYNSLVVEEEAV